MRKNYDFSKSRKNPYAKSLKRQITIRIDEDVIAYFKELSGTTGIAYQALMNLFLKECARNKKHPQFT